MAGERQEGGKAPKGTAGAAAARTRALLRFWRMGSGQAAGRPGCAGASVPKGTLKPPEGRFGLRPMGGKSRKSEQKATARLPWVESRATRTLMKFKEKLTE